MSSNKRTAAAASQGGEKKKLKQGDLFSFFGIKPKGKKKQPDDSSALWRKLQKGSRVAIYWQEEKKYYNATVLTSAAGAPSFRLRYDDGQGVDSGLLNERLDLSDEQFRILDGKGSKQHQEEEQQLKQPSQPEASNDSRSGSKKKRRISEESEAEMEFDIDEDEGSAYEHDEDAEEDDEELDEEDQWMVTDDEEETSKPKKKPRPKKKMKQRFQVTEVLRPSASKKTQTPLRPVQSKTISPHPSNKPQYTVTPPERVTPSPASVTSQPRAVKGAVNPAGSHVHNHLKFLKNPRDADGHPADDPRYDPRTLKVDYRELEKNSKLSPGSRQWWEIKARYFDTVLFFKTGKFYELYHQDADVGVQVLDFVYMKGEVAHAGFPEISYGTMADKLVRAGYKVARVEQTETPEMLKERKKKSASGKKPQVVNREVCSVMTLGTRTFCYLDDDSQLLQEGAKSTSAVGPLVAIREVLFQTEEAQADDDEMQPVCEYGVTIVDAPRATVTIGQFADDVLRSRMNTLLTTFQPSEILVEGGESGASDTLISLIRSIQTGSRFACPVERIRQKESFPQSNAVDGNVRRKLERKSPVRPWNVEETLEELHSRGYYPPASSERDTTSRWPKVLQAIVSGKAELAISSFGAALFYLQRSLIDEDILGMGLVKAYVPTSSLGADKTSSAEGLAKIVTQQYQEEDGVEEAAVQTTPAEFVSDETIALENEINHMSLDGTTLQNLDVLTNSKTHTTAGSLWSKLNHTKAPHGNRLLRAWMLRPLFRKGDIDRRADAVEELMTGGAAVAMSEARKVLAKCGDLERLLSRVHSMGGGIGSANNENRGHHPNERAILYETATHTKRRVSDFSKILSGLQQASRIPEFFEGVDIESGLLKKIVRLISDGGCFPDMTNELDWFVENFDCNQAGQGLFEPSRGVDEEYDEACDTIERVRRKLEDYKDEICRELHPSQLARSKFKYINTKADSKDKYLIELPASIAVPESFVVKGKRGSGPKQVNKYRTPVVDALVQELEVALDVQKEGKDLGMQRIFARFDSMRDLWAAAAQATAMLDALGSLAQASSKAGYVRPKILDCPQDGTPCFQIVQGRHPCVDFTYSGGQYIPNDLALGCSGDEAKETDSARVLLLSGPNMGGKSTLLRQTSLILILAQIGCFVPAEQCSLTPVDRIFTRLGASDRILLGQSTFFVELAETAAALRGATRRSLVLMDELGRGTSTFDGTAIASASVKHLVERNKCLTLFATHYHSLLEEWNDHPAVRVAHMSCLVEEGNSGIVVDSESTRGDETENIITFLYTLGEGPCPKSFGINVARLAGLPEEVLSKARLLSSKFEAEMGGVGEKNGSHPSSLRDAVVSATLDGDIDEVLRVWETLNATE